MTCTDCSEEITESERRIARTCEVCKNDLHAECSMIGHDGLDLCEDCFNADDEHFGVLMTQKGAEA